MMVIDGASRMSSVFGLKVSPRMAIFLPRTLPSQAAMTLRPMARLRLSLIATVVSMRRTGLSWSCAVLTSARVSLGKHDPP
jgi:hypothetical protein